MIWVVYLSYKESTGSNSNIQCLLLASGKYEGIITGKDFGTVFKNIPQLICDNQTHLCYTHVCNTWNIFHKDKSWTQTVVIPHAVNNITL